MELAFVEGSRSQPCIGETTAKGAISEAVQSILGIESDIALIQAERAFVHISRQMFPADLMPCAIESALEKCPHALDAVGCNIARAYILPCTVTDVLVNIAEKRLIAEMVVSMNRRA